MTDKSPKTEPEPPVEEVVVHDPSTITVEHNPDDPNSPDYVAPLPKS